MKEKTAKSKSIKGHLNSWVKEAIEHSGISQTKLAKILADRKIITSNDRSIVQKMTTTRVVKAHEVFAIAEITGFPAPNQTEDDAILVPRVSKIAAGSLTELASVDNLEDFPRIPAAGLSFGVWIAMEVDGGSMDKISPHGSLIFVNLADKEMVSGRCYVFQDEDGSASYKRFYANPLRFEPWSNGDYETFYPDQMPKIIGAVYRTTFEIFTPKVRN
ncbi:hypothetical protein EPK99_06615 [Neorhizobium lilium]|uniref:Uncharacterized protein n=1 Tax=Neorhizobium lilium TaxID=2503024 RepID=A0A3S3RUC9_9HYPH|nr:S24/S26 family peptidase [Neorhizobium lilium]RWX78297.1 hypothetical protein EPK99_06615 [Neorhizobium lilium]